jgi:KUP system potassium uptake protein
VVGAAFADDAQVSGWTTFYLGHVTVVPASPGKPSRLTPWRANLFRALKRNERSASMYFGIPVNLAVELGERLEL